MFLNQLTMAQSIVPAISSVGMASMNQVRRKASVAALSSLRDQLFLTVSSVRVGPLGMASEMTAGLVSSRGRSESAMNQEAGVRREAGVTTFLSKRDQMMKERMISTMSPRIVPTVRPLGLASASVVQAGLDPLASEDVLAKKWNMFRDEHGHPS
jgi:hypothetical protein